MVQNRIGCPIKAEKDLNFKSEIDLSEGIQRLIDWREESGV